MLYSEIGEEKKAPVAPAGHRPRGSSVGFQGKMFHIRGATATLTRTHQVPCRAKFLNSTDAFVVQASPSRFFIWYGTLCNEVKRKRATRTAVHIYANLTDKEKQVGNPEEIFKTVKEGEETEDFWRAVGGKDKYARFEMQETEAANQRLSNPKLFQTRLLFHHLRARPVVEYTPSDLHNGGVFLLDMHCIVFVWVGDLASQRLVEATKRLADEVAKDRKDAKTIVIQDGSEPAEFTQAFLGWHEVKRFIDPYATREQKLRDIGVVGRVISKAELDAEKKEMEEKLKRKDALKQ
uniref:Gelsolin-like domain-containing protein n=1 Tax=Lotharella oceanica TaxID=641309 RepID=A0A7S2TYH2_9EUKA|mmetsp:Transcript_3570/g.6919  ORF Transcript_3570/g.6919 Transcript_3570/m.6919 type:complete len:293 (+) Transcript_3570:1-879(+)